MKRLLIIVLVFTMMCMLCGTAFAVQTDTNTPSTTKEKTTDSRKDIKAEIEQMQERFDALEETQKNQIYDLADEITALNKELIEKYAELGIVSTETAGKICDMLSERSAKIREDGRFIPGFILPPPHNREHCECENKEEP